MIQSDSYRPDFEKQDEKHKVFFVIVFLFMVGHVILYLGFFLDSNPVE